MNSPTTTRSVLTLWLLMLVQASVAGQQKFANLGTCELQNGAVLEDCRIGYRTYGVINDDRSNIILLPTWYTGTTGDLETFGNIGPGKLADTDRYFVVALDSIGNGVSSSPSNSKTQAGSAFPAISIGDMVRSQHRLLMEILDISHAHAVMGGSMGGMQALEWSVRYPGFMDKVVTIVGTPWQTSYDKIFWGTHLTIIEAVAPLDFEAALQLSAGLGALHIRTPGWMVENLPEGDYPDLIAANVESARSYGLENRVPQLKAMIGHDITANFDGSIDAVAGVLQAELLIIVDTGDLMVNPAPSRRFAAVAGASYREFDSGCGHLLSVCNKEQVAALVNNFLDAGRD